MQNYSSKSKIILFIDTSSNQKISVGLKINKKEDSITQEIGKEKAQVVLPLIEKIIKRNTISLQDLTHITVSTGPGSFTGLRVGVSIANALSYALKIPVNDKPIGQFVEPVYE